MEISLVHMNTSYGWVCQVVSKHSQVISAWTLLSHLLDNDTESAICNHGHVFSHSCTGNMNIKLDNLQMDRSASFIIAHLFMHTYTMILLLC